MASELIVDGGIAREALYGRGYIAAIGCSEIVFYHRGQTWNRRRVHCGDWRQLGYRQVSLPSNATFLASLIPAV
jgi:hypothetical protein